MKDGSTRGDEKKNVKRARVTLAKSLARRRVLLLNRHAQRDGFADELVGLIARISAEPGLPHEPSYPFIPFCKNNEPEALR